MKNRTIPSKSGLIFLLNSIRREVEYDEPDEEELEKRREARRVEQASNPHYIKDDRKHRKKKLKDLAADKDGYDNIPVAQIDLSVPLHVPG